MTTTATIAIAAVLPANVQTVLTSAKRLEQLGCRLYDLAALGAEAVTAAWLRGLLHRELDGRVCLTSKGYFYASLLTA
jgi:hypothetical protein